MKRFIKTSPLVLLLTALMVAGCDSAETTEALAVETTETSELYTELVSELSLTAVQQSRVRQMFNRFESADHEPGFLWIVADSLAATLTDRQIERLLDRDKLRDRIHQHRRDFQNDEDGRYLGFGRGGRFEGWFASNLNLTEDQEEAIAELRANAHEQIQELVEQKRAGELSQEQFREAASAIRENVRTEIHALLTEEQTAELERRREERQANREEAFAESRQVRNRVLGLSDSEAAELDAIVDGLREAGRTLRDQVRAGEMDRDQFRERMQNLREEAEAEIEELLTEDQYLVVQIRHALGFRFGMKGHGPGNGFGHGFGRGGGNGFGR